MPSSYLSDPTYLVCTIITVPVSIFIGRSLFLQVPKEVIAAGLLASDRSTKPKSYFNWGAFTFGWIWAWAFRLPAATVLMFISGITVLPHLIFGYLGTDMAWNCSRQQSTRDFTLTQLAWKKSALWVWFVVSLICTIAAIITLIYQALAVMSRTH